MDVNAYFCKTKVPLYNCMKAYIPRAISAAVTEAAKFYPVIVLTGPRQTGKTTLARHLFDSFSFVNLEEADSGNFARTDVNAFLDSLGDRAIIDEVQNAPELLHSIQARVDADPERRYVLTGSNNFSLLHHLTQSLAGRAAMFTVLPFAFEELPAEELQAISTDELMWRGLYPGVVANGIAPYMFYRNYNNTYIERDIRMLANVHHLDSFQRFMRLCAGRVGTELNKASIGVDCGVTAPTIDGWLSLLQASYITYNLTPYYSNLRKRLTKRPKLYFYDTGLLCYLLGIEEPAQLSLHPLRGQVFENMAVNELMKKRLNAARDPNLSFYRESAGREVDIVQALGDGIHLYEVKAGKTFQPDFVTNLDYLRALLPDVRTAAVIYDGASRPPSLLNVRDI